MVFFYIILTSAHFRGMSYFTKICANQGTAYFRGMSYIRKKDDIYTDMILKIVS